MIRFERECRTPFSEVYTLYEDDQPQPQGRLDVHFFGRIIHATLCVSERYTPDEIQDIIADLDDELMDAIGLEREDFIVHVHQGREVGVFSNSSFAEDDESEPGSEN